MHAVTFALPDESRDFRKLWTAASPPGASAPQTLHGSLHGLRVCIAHVGVGPDAAASGIQRFFADVRPRLLICAGYAGALDPALRVGDLVLSSPAARTPPGARLGRIHSQATTAESIAEKRALFLETGASVVDMETAVIAEACAAAGVPLLALRVVSDSATQPLPVPMAHWFDLHKQRPRPVALIAYLARHPSSIAPFAQFVRGLSGARATLAAGISHLLADAAQQPLAQPWPASS